MSRIFGRQYDLESVCNKLVSEKYESYRPDNRKVPWEDVKLATAGLDVYLSPKAIELMEKKNFIIARNVLHRKPVTFVFNDPKDASVIVFPTFIAREEYKADFAKFLGEVTAGNPTYDNEYQQLIPLLFEYFYLTLKYENPDDVFEIKKLNDSVAIAKKFISNFKLYHRIPEYYGDLNFESDILSALQNISSLDVSLQLIEMMKTEPEKALKIIDDIILKKGHTYDILADNDIYSYGYKTLRKTIDNRKK